MTKKFVTICPDTPPTVSEMPGVHISAERYGVVKVWHGYDVEKILIAKDSAERSTSFCLFI